MSVSRHFFCRHHSVPVLCENGSAETTVAEEGRNDDDDVMTRIIAAAAFEAEY